MLIETTEEFANRYHPPFRPPATLPPFHAPPPRPRTVLGAPRGEALRSPSSSPRIQPRGKPSDRRRQRRIPFDEEIEIWQRSEGGQAFKCPAWGLNISSGGIRVISTQLLSPGERVGVQLRRDRNALPGRVAWIKPQQDGCVAGIAFNP